LNMMTLVLPLKLDTILKKQMTFFAKTLTEIAIETVSTWLTRTVRPGGHTRFEYKQEDERYLEEYKETINKRLKAEGEVKLVKYGREEEKVWYSYI
jgi:hypothetical protein